MYATLLMSFSEMQERSMGSLMISFRLADTCAMHSSTSESICRNSEEIRMDTMMALSMVGGVSGSWM